MSGGSNRVGKKHQPVEKISTVFQPRGDQCWISAAQPSEHNSRGTAVGEDAEIIFRCKPLTVT